MRHLYCRNCGYDLSPMFAKGEESGTCPECGASADIRRLRDREWRINAIISGALWGGVPTAGVFGLPLIVWAGGEPDLLLVVIPGCWAAGMFVALVRAGYLLSNRVRPSVAPWEFWTSLLWTAMLSGFVNVGLLVVWAGAIWCGWAITQLL